MLYPIIIEFIRSRTYCELVLYVKNCMLPVDRSIMDFASFSPLLECTSISIDFSSKEEMSIIHYYVIRKKSRQQNTC